jgi:hypothetical protein
MAGEDMPLLASGSGENGPDPTSGMFISFLSGGEGSMLQDRLLEEEEVGCLGVLGSGDCASLPIIRQDRFSNLFWFSSSLQVAAEVDCAAVEAKCNALLCLQYSISSSMVSAFSMHCTLAPNELGLFDP